MPIKKVYSIRINKDDEEIKKYLEQFPSSEHYKALKALIKYGVGKLQEDYAKDQVFKSLQETIQHIQEKQEKQFEEIKEMIKNLEIPVSSTKEVSNQEFNSDDSFDVKKAKETMKEALSMFIG
jgi:hypothetical protein